MKDVFFPFAVLFSILHAICLVAVFLRGYV